MAEKRAKAKPADVVMGAALSALNAAAGSKALDRFNLRKPLERAVFQGTKSGFRTLGAANRRFTAIKSSGTPTRPRSASQRAVFDLTPTEDQQMIREITTEFAAEQVRPAAAAADTECAPPVAMLKRVSSELGINVVGIPESLGGLGSERSTTTSVLVAEALSHGDMGLALAAIAPSAVSTAIVLWGDDSQQSTYLPSFVADNSPAAALAVLEPRPLFDPFDLRTRARRSGGGFVLDGVKSLVPLAASAELFVIAADLEGSGPALFIVESDTAGLVIEAEPAMGIRAASLGRILLNNVTVPATALLGEGKAEHYADCIRLGRVGWSALAVGTAQAVLDYVIPYVNDRVAFGEPVSHRQSVAFMVANIGIELEGMRLATYRAASRAEQGKSFARESAIARRLCSEYGMQIGSNGVQLLGGHGFVKEHPVERWYRNLRAVSIMEGAVLV
ncbi:hypothetical protein SAMN05444157_1221 [Frankineae bacterium MT45]|nr:hypothetical protein SAMN05444157_1221 [Frankineae bacterium MT45]